MIMITVKIKICQIQYFTPEQLAHHGHKGLKSYHQNTRPIAAVNVKELVSALLPVLKFFTLHAIRNL